MKIPLTNHLPSPPPTGEGKEHQQIKTNKYLEKNDEIVKKVREKLVSLPPSSVSLDFPPPLGFCWIWDKQGGENEEEGGKGKTLWVSVREGEGGRLRFLVNEKEGGEGRGRGRGKVRKLPAFDASELLMGCSEAEERVVVGGKERKILERAFYCGGEKGEGEGEGIEEEDPLSLFLDLQEIPRLLPSQVLFFPLFF